METKVFKKMLLAVLMLGANVVIRSADNNNEKIEKESKNASATLIQATCRGILERQTQTTQKQNAAATSIQAACRGTLERQIQTTQNQNAQKSPAPSDASTSSTLSTSSDTSSDSDESSAHESEILQNQNQNLIQELNALLEINGNDAQMTLMYAVTNNITWAIRPLLDQNVDINLPDQDGNTALIVAAENGYLATVKLLLAAGAHTDIADKTGNTPLIMAAVNGDTTTVKLLIATGAHINIASKQDRTALIWAIFRGHIEIVELLITAGAQIDLAYQNGCTALTASALCGHIEIAQIIINQYNSQLKKILQEKYVAIAHMNLKKPTGAIEQTLPLEVAMLIPQWLNTPDIASLRRTNTHCHLYARDEFNKNRNQSIIELKEKLIQFIKSAIEKVHLSIEQVGPSDKKAKALVLLQNELEKAENLNIHDMLALANHVPATTQQPVCALFEQQPVCALFEQQPSQNLDDANIAGPAAPHGRKAVQQQARNVLSEKKGKKPANRHEQELWEQQIQQQEMREQQIIADRALRAEQDREYAESLACDQQKDAQRQAALQRQQEPQATLEGGKQAAATQQPAAADAIQALALNTTQNQVNEIAQVVVDADQETDQPSPQELRQKRIAMLDKSNQTK